MRAEIFLNDSSLAELVGYRLAKVIYRQGNFLRNVYHLEVNATDDATALDICFQIFTSRLPKDYHERPVSVGDVIRLDGARMWGVETQGWSRLQEDEVRGMEWGWREAKLNPPAGASKETHERAGSARPKHNMKDDEAIEALKKLDSIVGHEKEVREILNEVRRDEWHDILDYQHH